MELISAYLKNNTLNQRERMRERHLHKHTAVYSTGGVQAHANAVPGRREPMPPLFGEEWDAWAAPETPQFVPVSKENRMTLTASLSNWKMGFSLSVIFFASAIISLLLITVLNGGVYPGIVAPVTIASTLVPLALTTSKMKSLNRKLAGLDQFQNAMVQEIARTPAVELPRTPRPSIRPIVSNDREHMDELNARIEAIRRDMPVRRRPPAPPPGPPPRTVGGLPTRGVRR